MSHTRSSSLLLALTLLLLALVIPTRAFPLPQPTPNPIAAPDAVADALASRLAAISRQIGKIPVVSVPVTAPVKAVVRPINPKLPTNPKKTANGRRSVPLDALEDQAESDAEAAAATATPTLLPRGATNPKKSKTLPPIKVVAPTPPINPKHVYVPPIKVVGAPTTHPGEPRPYPTSKSN